ncbi:MAG: hypothetical protein ACE15E_03040 [Acidobacteriota bacterium]
MRSGDNKLKVLDLRGSEHEYLHKDFHGALCYAIRYLDEKFGLEATDEYLRQVGRNNYKPLIAALKAEGLIALERHWRTILGQEGRKFRMSREGDELVLFVDACPAIEHMKKTGQTVTKRYCQTTVSVNEAICEAAGFKSSCEYEPGEGRCVQRFRKAEVQA